MWDEDDGFWEKAEFITWGIIIAPISFVTFTLWCYWPVILIGAAVWWFLK